MLLMLLALFMSRGVRLQADLHAAVAAQPPRQIDALLLENQFVRVHLVTLNDVNHFRSTTDAAQVLYCLGSFMVLRDDGSFERCTRGHVLFAASGTIDFRADGDARPDMLIAEIKLSPAGGGAARADDATRVAPDIYKVLLENDTVRVMSVQIKPGQRAKMHWHPGYALRYPLTTAKTRATTPEGLVIDMDLRARVPRWIVEESEHTLENVGTTDSATILIELKRSLGRSLALR